MLKWRIHLVRAIDAAQVEHHRLRYNAGPLWVEGAEGVLLADDQRRVDVVGDMMGTIDISHVFEQALLLPDAIGIVLLD